MSTVSLVKVPHICTIEYETKDPVKRYQFEYNKSLCMASKYPEISTNDNELVSIAPGEGKIPKDIMAEEDWEEALLMLSLLSNGKKKYEGWIE